MHGAALAGGFGVHGAIRPLHQRVRDEPRTLRAKMNHPTGDGDNIVGLEPQPSLRFVDVTMFAVDRSEGKQDFQVMTHLAIRHQTFLRPS